MARSKWLLTGLGAMIVPVKTVKLSKDIDVPMKEFHNIEGCGFRLGRQTVCKGCGKIVPREEVGKGYVFNDKQEKPLQFTKEEIASLHPTDIPEGTLQIVNFIEAVPFKYFNGNHKAVIPQDKNPNVISALAVFYEGLRKSKKVALIRYWDSNTAYFATLNAEGVMSGVFYSDEVSDEKEDLELVNKSQVSAPLLSMMEKVIKLNTKPFDLSTALHDTYRENMTARAMEKQETGQLTIVASAPVPVADPTQDLMAMLTQAVEQAEQAVAGTDTAPAPAKAKKAKKTA